MTLAGNGTYHQPAPGKIPSSAAPTKGKSISREDVEKLLDMYYEQRGWDANGFPTEEKLAELGLTDIATV